MHMWMWFGYDLGEFMFAGLNITSRWSFALTWIALFFIALLFEGSKVYLANVQRKAHLQLYPFRSDERRNLLCDREQAGIMEPTTSRNASSGQVSRWSSMRVRLAVNFHQSAVFLAHNVVGYLLMLAVMVYNVHLMLAVVFGMMLGYFLFGPKLTRLQMQCFGSKRTIICTPECDDTDRCNKEKCSWEVCEGKLCKEMDALEQQQASTPLTPEPYRRAKFIIFEYPIFRHSCMRHDHGIAEVIQQAITKHAETSTPPLLESARSSQSELFACRTRTCIQPSHYFLASAAEGSGEPSACHYGAKHCPSKVARAKRSQPCHYTANEKEDIPSVEDAQLLRTERQGCCKKKQEPPPDEKRCGKSSHEVAAEAEGCCEETPTPREDSPQVTCCAHNAKPSSDSQEQIIQ